MSMLKDVDGDRPADQIAPGANTEGKVVMLTPEQAAKLAGERDADEEAFAGLLPPDGDETEDFSDLDDPLPNEG